MRNTLWLVVVFLSALAFGCKQRPAGMPPDKPNIEGGLRKTFPVLDRLIVTEYLRNIGLGFQASPGASPKTIEELEQVHGSSKITKAIQDGSITVVLSVNPERQPGESILAYQTEADAQGERVVLTCSGGVKVMNAKTFDAAPKAQGK
jgi:hypothetical protein